MTKLLLVRHGVTEFNTDRRFMGDSDIELSAEGCRQIERLRNRLADQEFHAIYCSDLKRAVSTAAILNSGRQLGVISCPELREISYGELEGLTFQEIGQRYPDLAKMIINFNLGLAFPGGESFHTFIERTVRFIDRLKQHNAEETVLIVSHGGPLRVLVCHLLGIAFNCWWQIRIDNASLSILETYPQGTVISLLNDTSHLREPGG